MNSSNCAFERVSNVAVGALLLLIGLGFSVIGVTILPFVGLLVALPVLGLSGLFLSAQRSKECSL